MARLNLKSNIWWTWVLLALMAIGVSLSLIPQEEFWWHLKIGEWIRANNAIPRTGLYSATGAAAPLLYPSWGGEWLLAVFYDLGGLPLIVLVRNLLFLATYGLFAWHTLRRTRGNGRAAAVGLFLAGSAAFNSWGAGPQIVVWPLFMLAFALVSEVGLERWPRRALLATPLIQIVWVNLSGAWIVGPLLVGCAALGAVLDRRRDHSEAPTYPTARALWLAFGATTVATLAHPRGLSLVSSVWNLLPDRSSQPLVGLWVSPLRSLDQPATQLFFLSLLIAAVMVAALWKQLRSADLLTFVALTGLVLATTSYQLWFGLVAGAIVAEALVRRGRLKLIKNKPQRSSWLAWVTLGLALLAVLAQLPIRSLVRFPAVVRGAEGSLPNAELAVAATPVQAVDYLLQNPPSGGLFHEVRYSSYLIWRAGEQLPAFIDMRTELYPAELWFEYQCVVAGRDWEPLLAKYNLTTVLADRALQPSLIAALRQSGFWRERYSDLRTLVFERDPAAPPPSTAATCPTELAAKD